MNFELPTRLSTREQLIVVLAAVIGSITAILWSWHNSAFLLYGDAEAHIHIARRLFDSHRPGITQLGSVWLPFSHLILVPFVAIDPWWRNGFAPVIPSAICFILSCIGLYRLARKWLSPASASIALAIFATNPNLLYLQTTAMTEPLFLCELIWTVLLAIDWFTSLELNPARANRLLWFITAIQVASVYTRYDGWILAFFVWLAMAICLYRRGKLFHGNFILASVLLLLAPISWMSYNAVVFGDWLDFMRGPYSAKAIELRTSSSAVDPHPGWHNPWTSLVYFVKAAEMDAAALRCGEFLMTFAVLGTAWAWLNLQKKTTFAWTLFLWLPLPFYAYSISYGSVPIFLPVWKPFSYYNTRYGMELLPALAFFTAFSIEAALFWIRSRRPGYSRLVVAAIFLLLAANVAEMLREKPLTYEEAKRNTAARGYYNTVLAQALNHLHTLDPNGVILMNTSTYSSLVPHAGLTYRETINESDKQFYWAALDAPAQHADIVMAFAGDEIDKAVKAHPQHLRVYQAFHSPSKGWDQNDVTLYVADTSPLAQAQPPASSITTQ